MYIGAAYYPELWKENEVEKDVERCKAYGINALRIGEFAWSKMEPREGEYDFDWLERAVDKLYENGIYTVLCTPTCTPPRWLFNKYPDVVRVLSDGKRMPIASRCHPCKSSLTMRKKNSEIVTEMAKRFGSHKGVIGWQIDNELYAYDGGCYCEDCRRGFRKTMKEKYGDIDKLNESWGMYRWSLNYLSFDDIEPPPPLGTSEWKHPSLEAEWLRYQLNLIISYVKEQSDILHGYTKAPVGTDMMPSNKLSYYDMNENLDVVQFNHYGTANMLFWDDCFYDFLRPIKDRPFWVTETQVGWNGSEFAECGYRPIGNCYANTWLPISLGGEMNMYWLFRTHPNGHELAHGAVFNTAGRPYRVSEEVLKASRDMDKCQAFLEKGKIKSDIAIHYSSVCEQNFQFAPILKAFNYRVAVNEKFHAAFKHYNVDLIDTGHSLDSYKVVFSPFLATIDKTTEEKIKAWVENGGVWIAGPMSDIMTECISKYTDAPFSFLEEYAGVYTKYQKPIANDVFRAVWNDGEELGISACYDAFEAVDSESLAKYDGDEFGGYSVVTEKKVGKGKVIMLGSVLSHEGLRRLAGIAPIAEASGNIRLVERSGEENGIIALELRNEEGYITLDGEYTELLSGRVLNGKVSIAPYEVLVLKKI